MISVHIDGASRNNPGTAGIGVLAQKDGKEVLQLAEYIGKTTNNVAEYTALIRALEELLLLGHKKAHFYSDSQLLVEQVCGRYRVKDEKLKGLHSLAQKLASKMEVFRITHIPREKNRDADRLANKGIDAQSSA
ncbi:MAG: ribonuclease HI family protein [Candidatus Margulisiibacteriota bacterium]